MIKDKARFGYVSYDYDDRGSSKFDKQFLPYSVPYRTYRSKLLVFAVRLGADMGSFYEEALYKLTYDCHYDYYHVPLGTSGQTDRHTD